MYQELKGFPPPDEKAILWRYMTVEQFIDMLARESLFLQKHLNLQRMCMKVLSRWKWKDF